MRRRTFVGVASGAVLGGLAGCAAPIGGQDDETTEPEGEGGATDTTTTETTTTETTTEGGTTAEDGTTTAAGGGNSVRMVTSEDNDYYFDPIGLYVEPGTTVEWVNESGSHSSTAYAEGNGSAQVTRIPDDAEPWDSGILTEGGATFSYTFEVEGTYDYFCTPHKTLGMVARVVCGEPGGVEGDPPDGAVPDPQTIVDQGAVSYEEFGGGGTTTDGG